MTHHILKSISFIFHPVIMPLLGVLFYFSKTRRFIPNEIIYAKLVSISILTVFLPILFYFLLKTLRRVETVYLKTSKERITPLLLNGVVVLLIINRVLPFSEIVELYYFFVGILVSTITCLLLALFNFKASLHMVGLSGIGMFFLALSLHFSININGTLALLAIVFGAVATSRLHLKAHNYNELIIGALVGFMPQLLLLKYWL
ncbi:membrane protein [Mangrovimonas yunxiaonensis]|uniref:Membrane protein n=1 Tax=Mangrovimonas yunxiaonensis TaxID=1197477 RepID=A0A084TMI9_9FLAO|nr:hypothetical protein [Mangrovimonas yunxiaonensis]KFB01925.1 membrane protein [Mangrovimonas yunxiaonensis]GGH44760.1 hypothetical protein GCM10011364_17760 [Mangrovimonas yunxiaonensis]